MEKTKIIVILIAASILIAAVAGIAYAQYANAQTNGNYTNQAPQSTPSNTGDSYAYPQQGYYPYGSTPYGYPYGYGMGMCGRFW